MSGLVRKRPASTGAVFGAGLIQRIYTELPVLAFRCIYRDGSCPLFVSTAWQRVLVRNSANAIPTSKFFRQFVSSSPRKAIESFFSTGIPGAYAASFWADISGAN